MYIVTPTNKYEIIKGAKGIDYLENVIFLMFKGRPVLLTVNIDISGYRKGFVGNPTTNKLSFCFANNHDFIFNREDGNYHLTHQHFKNWSSRFKNSPKIDVTRDKAISLCAQQLSLYTDQLAELVT